jgi:hypothetical protein
LDVGQEQYHQPANITCVSITSDCLSGGSGLKINFREHETISELEEELTSSTKSKESCRLFVIENICPRTMSFIGGSLDIDPQFFADHLNNTSWYRIADVENRLTALPSVQKLQDFLQLRFIEIRTVLPCLDSSTGTFGKEKEADAAQDPWSDVQSFVVPDKTATTIPRKAGKLAPRRTQQGHNFDLLLCTRQVVSVWFQEKKPGEEGWIGIHQITTKTKKITNASSGVILLDPPFKMPGGDSVLKIPEYRSFWRRPSLREPSAKVALTNESYHKTLIEHIKAKFEGSQSLLEEVRAEPFFILGDLYRLVASHWIVVNEYINRELSTIEYIIEKEEPSFRDLEIYLKEVYVYRRRCTKYHELITLAKNQCNQRGQKCWPHKKGSGFAVENSENLEEDFAYLQDKTMSTVQRTQKTINLLTALVAIGEGKQGLEENHGIARLSLLATIFLPFSTIATILGMQGNYAPGSGGFWLFWTVAIPLTALIVALFILYGRFGKSAYRRSRSF